jgi:hypothetical protein
MRNIEWAFILSQVKKGMPKEELLKLAVPVPDLYWKKDCVIIKGYEISLWTINSIYEIPAHYEDIFKVQNMLPGDTVINEEWLNNLRFVTP